MDFAALEIVEALPLSRWRPTGGESVFRALEGGTIIRAGGAADEGIEGGGLILDFVPVGGEAVRRIVFGFNENGMWIEYDGQARQAG